MKEETHSILVRIANREYVNPAPVAAHIARVVLNRQAAELKMSMRYPDWLNYCINEMRHYCKVEI